MRTYEIFNGEKLIKYTTCEKLMNEFNMSRNDVYFKAMYGGPIKGTTFEIWESETHSYCTKCNTIKPNKDFSRTSGRNHRPRSWCKECMKNYGRKLRMSKKEGKTNEN